MTSRFEETYTWDTADNLLKLKHTVGQSSWTRRFGMGGQSPDQWDTLLPQHSGDTQWPGAPSNAPTHAWDSGQTSATHTYDAAGQLTAEGTSRHFEWDQAGRLKVYRTQVTGSEPSIYAIYLYDSAGQRLKKWVRRQGGSRIDTTVYIGGIFERHERVDSGVTTVNNTLHIIDGAQRIGTERVGPAFPEDSSPTIQYHLAEPHGTSNLVVDGSGSWCNREEYSPFGESVFGGFARKRYRYTGQERDEESGLGYHSARYYASWLFRWTRPDPAGLVDGGNLYGYVRGSPIRGVDPSGMQDKDADSYSGPLSGALFILDLVSSYEGSEVEGYVKEASDSLGEAFLRSTAVQATLGFFMGVELGLAPAGFAAGLYGEATGEFENLPPAFRFSMGGGELIVGLGKGVVSIAGGLAAAGGTGGGFALSATGVGSVIGVPAVGASLGLGVASGVLAVDASGHIGVGAMNMKAAGDELFGGGGRKSGGGGASEGGGSLDEAASTLRGLDDVPWGQYCRSGCEDVASSIQKAIGGDVHRIKPSASLPGSPTLGPRSGQATGWFHHEVVVKDGRVFDAMTGPRGLPVDEYKAAWEYADVIDFGF